jgi:uncharacterized protein YjbI with pentapeptide repeats
MDSVMFLAANSRIRNVNLSNTRIVGDGVELVGCSFVRCDLSGLTNSVIKNCFMDGCKMLIQDVVWEGRASDA